MNGKSLCVAITLLSLATSLQLYPQGKTATFKVQVRNEGRLFKEVVKIDVARGTETFDVPSQQGFEEAQIVHDFLKKLTMTSLPDKQVCYLSKLSDSLPSPSRLIEAFKQAAVGDNDSNLERVETTMEVKELLKDQTSLSVAMKKQCRDFPIYRIEPAEESVSITKISDEIEGDDHDRLRRSHCSGEVCETVTKCYMVPCGSGWCFQCKDERICKTVEC